MTKHGLPMEFLKQAINHEGDECVLWPFARTGNGHAKISINGKIEGAPRIMCEWKHGPPPSPKLDAAHSCGKGHLGCISPHHVSWKTRKENEADKWLHGTRTIDRPTAAKLTPTLVKIIRASSLQGVQLARLFMVTPTAISLIKNYKTWKAA